MVKWLHGYIVKVLLVAFLLSLLYPAFYLIFQLLTPQGFVFSGMVGGDDGTNLAVMASVNHNLENPWALEEPKNVFLNPNMGSPFLFVPLGYIAKFLGNRFLLTFQISRFLGAFFFLISTYIFLKEFFSEKKAWRIFLLFCFSFGLGGLLFLRLKSLVPNLPYVGMWRPITYELFEGAGLLPLTILGRHYYTLSLGCGLLSLVFARRLRFVVAGTLLALTFLVYPTLGVSFWLVSAIYHLIFSEIQSRYKNILVMYMIAVVGILPWTVLYLVDSAMFKFYGSLGILTNPSGLFVSMAPNFFFALITFLGLFRLKKLKLKGTSIFFSFWFLTALVLSLLRIPLSARFMLVLWLPLVVLSYVGIEGLSKILKNRISPEFFVALLIALTFPSAIFFGARFLRKSLEPTRWELFPDYLPESEKHAIEVLESLPDGVVLSSDLIGANLPFLANKKSVLGRESIVRDYAQKLKDFQIFFNAGAAPNDRWERVEKYEIDYVYFGKTEMDVSRWGINIKDLDIFSKVFEDSGVIIYRTQ